MTLKSEGETLRGGGTEFNIGFEGSRALPVCPDNCKHLTGTMEIYFYGVGGGGAWKVPLTLSGASTQLLTTDRCTLFHRIENALSDPKTRTQCGPSSHILGAARWMLWRTNILLPVRAVPAAAEGVGKPRCGSRSRRASDDGGLLHTSSRQSLGGTEEKHKAQCPAPLVRCI
jgi:hypothetical protein